MEMHILGGPLYFDDAESKRMTKASKKLEERKIKKYFETEVKRLIVDDSAGASNYYNRFIFRPFY